MKRKTTRAGRRVYVLNRRTPVHQAHYMVRLYGSSALSHARTFRRTAPIDRVWWWDYVIIHLGGKP